MNHRQLIITLLFVGMLPFEGRQVSRANRGDVARSLQGDVRQAGSLSSRLPPASRLRLGERESGTLSYIRNPGTQAPGSQPAESPAHKYFTDTPLVDQDGRERRFYTDLLDGRVVVINSFFASCKDSCPIMNATLARIQDWLGDRLDKDAFLISITVDPQTDTPDVLKQYAQRFKARPGWSFLTGKPGNVEFVLRKLGQYVGAREDHLNIFIIGNERTGLWKKAFGLARPDDIIKVVDSVLSDKN